MKGKYRPEGGLYSDRITVCIRHEDRERINEILRYYTDITVSELMRQLIEREWGRLNGSCGGPNNRGSAGPKNQ